MAIEEWSGPDFEVLSDAHLSGSDSRSSGDFFHKEFPEFICSLDLSISALELLSIVVCLKIWAFKSKHKRIRLLSNNSVSVQVINMGKTPNSFMQNCLREICYIAALTEFEVRAVHISGYDNRISDYLSRYHIDVKNKHSFFETAEKLGVSLGEEDVADDTFKFSHDW